MMQVNVEVVLKENSNSTDNKITNVCYYFLKSNKFRPGTVISNFKSNENLFIHETIDHIIIGENSNFENNYIDFTQVKIKWFLYTLDKSGQQVETEYDQEGQDIQLATVRLLPSSDYFNLWENLIYDSTIKENLLKYASTAMLYADKGIDCNIVSCNRVVLLHGPPGTGKTSLCKALAHKLTVRLNSRFKRGFLLEINSHSLFSKWFSESGKMVTKMFSRISEFLKDPEAIIFVLIDEVESLTHARDKCMSGVEPSDSLRAVNALLTQIDQMKNYSNVLILTTSNITGAIDLAFIDRADIKQYIGLPTPEAIYQIYYSCIQELLRTEIIRPKVVIPPIHTYINPEYIEHQEGDVFDNSRKLFKLSEVSTGLSGRTLRKVPFLAHSLFLENDTVTLDAFFDAMTKTIKRVQDDKKHFSSSKLV